MSKKNIIFVTHHLGGVGGVQQFIATLAKQFVQDGNRVTVIGMCPPKGAVYKQTDDARQSYEEICLYKDDIFTTKPYCLFLDSYITKRSAKAIQAVIDQSVSENPHTELIISNPLTFFFLKNVDYSKCQRVVGQMHNSAEYLFQSKGLYKLYAYFIKKYYRDLDAFLMLTKADAEQVRQVFKWDTVSYIENPLPFVVQEAERASLQNKNVVMLGRLDAIKQVDVAIDVFARATKGIDGWTFDIYGMGEEQQKLQQMIHDRGLEQSVMLRGFSSDVDVIYKGASILIQTSLKEGLPMSIMEAMAFGVPVVAYNCSPGVEQLVKGAGMLIDLNDSDAFVRGLRHLMSDDDLLRKLSNQSFHSIKDYNAKQIAQRWYNLFERGIE